MLERLLTWVRDQFLLTQDVARLKHENVELRRELNEQAEFVRVLARELQHDRELRASQRESDARERDSSRENLMLRLELELQRRLPPPRNAGE